MHLVAAEWQGDLFCVDGFGTELGFGSKKQIVDGSCHYPSNVNQNYLTSIPNSLPELLSFSTHHLHYLVWQYERAEFFQIKPIRAYS